MVLASSAPASELTHSLSVNIQGSSYHVFDSAADEAGLADAITLQPTSASGSAQLSLGRYGDLGVQSNLWNLGVLDTRVDIGMYPAAVNPFGVPRHAQGQFVVDGGTMTLIAGLASTVSIGTGRSSTALTRRFPMASGSLTRSWTEPSPAIACGHPVCMST